VTDFFYYKGERRLLDCICFFFVFLFIGVTEMSLELVEIFNFLNYRFGNGELCN
jgi:hypothetical protein